MTPCHIYRAPRRAYTYLFLTPDLAWEDLPANLAKLFEGAEKIMELELDSGRSLAQENVEVVIAHLESDGYHLQLPPEDDPGGWLDLPSNRG